MKQKSGSDQREKSNHDENESSASSKSIDDIVRLEIFDSNSTNGEDGHWKDAGQIKLLSDDNSPHKLQESDKKPLHDSVKNILGGNKHYAYRHSPDGLDSNLLILLHGSGDSHVPFDRLAKTMALPQTAVLSISASIPDMFTTIPFDLGYTWFQEVDFFETGMDLPENHPLRLRTLEKAVTSFRRILSALIKENAWLPERIFLFGFSCGACLVMETALDLAINSDDSLLSRPLGGAVCIAGGIKGHLNRSKHDKNSGDCVSEITPVLLVAGSNDRSFPPKQAHSAKIIYESAIRRDEIKDTSESSVTIHLQKGKAHGMISSPDEMRAVMKFFSGKLIKRMVGLEGMRKR